MSGGIVEKIRESIRRSNFLIEQSRALVLATAGLVSESSDTRARRLHRVGLTQFQLNWNNDLVSSPPDPGAGLRESNENFSCCHFLNCCHACTSTGLHAPGEACGS
jgi:hypothetical protein